MFLLNNISSPYKIISLIFSKDILCLRLVTPCYSVSSVNSDELLLSTDKVVNLPIKINNQYYTCSHEIHLDKNNELWDCGNHLVFYTTPDLYINGVIAVTKKENLRNIAAVTVLAEILCADKNQDFYEADAVIYADPKGLIYTNRDISKITEPINFGFNVVLKGPSKVLTNQIFDINIEMDTISGIPVSGDIYVSNISGYIPNKKVTLVNGKGTFKCSSLLVNDEVIISYKGQTLTVEIENE